MKNKPNTDQQLEEIKYTLLKAKQKLLAIEHSALCQSLRQIRAERKEVNQQLKEMGAVPF